MEVTERLAPCSNPHGDEDSAENRSVSELVSALRTASSRAEDFGRVEEALAAREAKLRREIEKQRNEKALLEEKLEFERLEKLRAEDELKQSMAAREVVVKIEEDEDEEGKEVISLPRRKKLKRKGLSENMQRRRSERLALIVSVNKDNNNNCIVNKNLPISGYRKGIKKEIMRKKKMGKKKMYGRGEDYVQFRCNMLSFFNTMQRIKHHLTEAHLELLRKTPFWPLISAFYKGVISEDQCKKSDKDVRNIVKCYKSRTMRFEFGGVSAPLTTEDIAEILGLPQEGQVLKLKGSRKYESDFIKRYFEVKRVLKTGVDAALEEAIKGKRETDVEDVVRLIVIELCITFLLCNSGQVTSWNLVRYCEDLENISRYSWAKAVTDLLHEALLKKTRRLSPYSVPGCVVAILLWLCEKTNLIQPIEGREGHTPALVKWSLRELHLKLKQIDVADIGLSFKEGKEKKKKRKEKENEKTHEEAEIDGQEDVEEGEDAFDDVVGSLGDELRAQKTQKKFLPTPAISKRLNNENEDLGSRSDDFWDMIQNASEEVAKAQGKVNKLTEKLESKKERTKKLKRKLKEETEEKRKLKEDNEMLVAEKKSLFDTVKRLVKKLEGTLEAEREKVKNLMKEKTELMEENQELKVQLSQGSPSTTLHLREDIQVEVSAEQSCSTGLEKSSTKRALDAELEYDQGGEKKRKVQDEQK